MYGMKQKVRGLVIMRNRFWKWMLPALLLAVCLMSACGSPANAPEDKEIVRLDVILDWYPNAIHTFLYEAVEQGYFAQEGLEVRLITPAESVDAVNFVASGKAQIGLSYPVDILQAYASGMPVLSIGAISQKALDCMCALASNETITDDMTSLKGKTIGYAGTQVSKAVVDTVTSGAGLAASDFTLLNVGFDLVTSLTTGNADLVVGTFLNDEIVTMQNMGYELQVFSEQEYGVPELYGLVFCVNREDYEARPEVYEGFLRACQRGFADMKADEDAALELIMSSMNTADNPLDEVQQRESYEILIPLMETEEAPFLSMDGQVWQKIMEWMVDTGQMNKEVDVANVISNILP